MPSFATKARMNVVIEDPDDTFKSALLEAMGVELNGVTVSKAHVLMKAGESIYVDVEMNAAQIDLDESIQHLISSTTGGSQK